MDEPVSLDKSIQVCAIYQSLIKGYTGTGYTKSKNQKLKYSFWNWYSTMKINFIRKKIKNNQIQINQIGPAACITSALF